MTITIRISIKKARTWFQTARRRVWVWKMFCMESNMDAKKRLAIQKIKRPATISKVVTVLIDWTELIIRSESKYFWSSGRADIIEDTMFGEAWRILTKTMIIIIKRGMTENKKLKAQEPAKDKSLFWKKYFIVRKMLCEKVTNVIFLGFFLLIKINWSQKQQANSFLEKAVS